MPGSWCLSFHAAWRCRHSGACCRAGWAIPIEAAQFEALAARLEAEPSTPLFVTGGLLPEGAAAMLGTTADGSCVFFDRDSQPGTRPAGSCSIHRAFGPERLPLACRQFPRVVLRDGRGTSITLSHYCPTAAALLFDTDGFEIVSAPPNIGRDAVEGLDATDVLPPLLRSGVLIDPDGYAVWERWAIRTLSSNCGSADAAVETIAAATRAVQRWSPSEGSLAEAVSRAFDGLPAVSEPEVDPLTTVSRAGLAVGAVPAALARPELQNDLGGGLPAALDLLRRHDRAVRAYLAARLFANWIAYSPGGLTAVVEYLRVVLAVLRVEAARQEVVQRHLPERDRLIEAIRQSDLLLVHLADHRQMASNVSAAVSDTASLTAS